MLKDSRQAGAQIGVTPAMIEAGVDALSPEDYYQITFSCSAEWLVEKVYRAMVSALHPPE